MAYKEAFYKVEIGDATTIWWNFILPTLPANSVIIHYSYTLFDVDRTTIVDKLTPPGTNTDTISDSRQFPAPALANKKRRAMFMITITGPVPEPYKLVLDIMSSTDRITPVKKFDSNTQTYVEVPRIELNEHYSSGADAILLMIELI